MKNENLISFLAYYKKRHDPEKKEPPEAMTEELSSAIQTLIQQLRDCKPLKQPS